MPKSGTIPFDLCEHVAGLIAEHGVTSISIADPRFCVTNALSSRTTDLPGVLRGAYPGTTLSLGQVALLVDGPVIRWAGDGPLADALAALAGRSDPPG